MDQHSWSIETLQSKFLKITNCSVESWDIDTLQTAQTNQFLTKLNNKVTYTIRKSTRDGEFIITLASRQVCLKAQLDEFLFLNDDE